MIENRSLVLTIAITASLASCSGSKPGNDAGQTADSASSVPASPASSSAIDRTYIVDAAGDGDSVVFENNDYRVIVVPHDGEVGDLIGVYDKSAKKSFSVDEGESYFAGVADKYLIVDNGSSNMRGLSVYDLKSASKVFESSYVGDLEVKKGAVLFKTPVEIADSTKRPKCPAELKDVQDGIGYVEVQIFDLKTLRLKKTGDCECFYFE